MESTRESMERWRKQDREDRKRWHQTEAYRALRNAGVIYDNIGERLYWAFKKDEIDGTFAVLEDIMMGNISIRDFGIQSQLRMALAFMYWFKQRLEWHKEHT